VPTQVSVLAHVTTTRALAGGAPLDLLFQSVAGTAAGNRAFGVDLALLDDADAAIREHGRLPSPHAGTSKPARAPSERRARASTR
jgi:ethanolamine ammonia-lyase large subunit